MNSYKDFLLIEVISANVDVNQTVSTAVSVSKLKHQHRRSRRSVEEQNNAGLILMSSIFRETLDALR